MQQKKNKVKSVLIVKDGSFLDGCWFDGCSLNNCWLNGWSLDGYWLDGHSLDRCWLDGYFFGAKIFTTSKL